MNRNWAWFKITGLVESPDPFKASALASINLYNLVTEQDDPDFLLGLIESPEQTLVCVEGEHAEDPILAVKYFWPTAVVEACEAPSKSPSALMEIVPTRTEHSTDPFADVAALPPDDIQQQLGKITGGRDAVPNPNPDPMVEMYQCMRDTPGGAIVTWLSPASDLEQSMADEYWHPAFAGGSAVEWQMWRGTKMIRARSFLCSEIGCIPPRMRAERKIMSQRIGFAELSAADREELRHPTADMLKGFAVPYGVYRSLVMLPSAGASRRIPGIPTVKPPAAIAPLDISPDLAAASLRLGEAISSDDIRFAVGQTPTDKQQHVHIIGQPGAGKTSLLVNDTVQYVANGTGSSYLDPHGDGSRRALRDISPFCRTRVWFINHCDAKHIVPINPLYAPDEATFARLIAAANDAMRTYVDPKGEGMWAERMTRIFTMIGWALWYLGTVTLPLIASIVGSQDLCRKLASRVEPIKPALAKQIMDELGNLTSSDSRDVFAWAASRLGQMLNSPILMKILGTGANAIDMASIMDRGETLLVDLGSSQLGPDAVRVLEMCYLILIDEAKNQRQRRDKTFVTIVDEAHTVQIGPLASLLDEGRKFGVGVEVAHQRLGQLDDRIADALEADTATFICLRTGVKDGARASIRLRDWPVTDLSRLPAFQAAAVICRDGVPTEPFSLFIDPPKNYEGADLEAREANAQRIIDETIATFSAPYAGLEPITPDNIRDFLSRPADPGRLSRLAALRAGPVIAPACAKDLPELDALCTASATKETELTRLASDIRSLMDTKLARVFEAVQQPKLDDRPTDQSGTSRVSQFLAARQARLESELEDEDEPL